jgi:hypothetical protein
MGCDLILNVIPCPEKVTADLQQRLLGIVDALTADELAEVAEWTGHDAEDVPQALRDAIEELPYLNGQHRQTACFTPHQGGRYLICGGMSWGDSPSEAFDTLGLIGNCSALYKALYDACEIPPCRLALREFVDDVEGVGIDYVKAEDGLDWPDLAITYQRAKAALGE